MPICTSCSEDKDKSLFFMRDKQTGVLHKHCKECYKQKRQNYQKEHYLKYTDSYKQRARTRKIIVKTALQDKLLNYLSDKKCASCGITDIRVLDFDHLDPTTKSFSIARALTNGMKWEYILAEINKCQILCANCHRIRTSSQFNWYRHLNYKP